MNWILKNKNFLCGNRLFKGFAGIKNILKGKRIKTLFVVLFLVFAFLGSFQFAHAGVGDAIGGIFTDGIRYVLTQLNAFMGWLFAAAATLFAVVVDPNNISGSKGILNKQAVKDVWIMVRDTLNMAFILVLLFAAFCTIFQVEKWNLKKVWLNILINALLVNFSFPIARFFIDISNVAMYYFINHMFSATGTTTAVTGNVIMAMFASSSKIGAMLMPGQDFASFDISYQIAMIIFTFIMAMTLVIVAVLFTIRLVALVIIIMFSPIGFVGYIFPATSGFADQWWKNLFSYAFFGPIMIFMMSIALQIATAIGRDNFTSFMANASINSSSDQSTWIASVAFYAIPIIILWMGLGLAKGMGIAGADAVVSTGKKWGKSLAMTPWGGAKFLGKGLGITGGAKLGWENFKKKGPLFGTDKQEARAAALGRLLGDKHAVNDVQSKRVKDASDHHDTANMTDTDLRNLQEMGDKFEKAAALGELANRGKATAKDMQTMKALFPEENSRAFNQLRNKVKTYNPVAAFATKFDANGNVTAFDKERMTEHLNSNQFDAKKVNADALGAAAFVGLAMETGNMKPEDLDELAKKSDAHASNIKKSLTAIVNETRKDAAGNTVLDRNGNPILDHQNMNDEKDRGIHLAYVASTGEIHPSLNATQRKEIISRLNKDNAKSLKEATINALAATGEIAEHVNAGKFKEIVSNMKSNESKRAFVQAVITAPPSSRQESLKKQIKKDPFLSGFM